MIGSGTRGSAAFQIKNLLGLQKFEDELGYRFISRYLKDSLKVIFYIHSTYILSFLFWHKLFLVVMFREMNTLLFMLSTNSMYQNITRWDILTNVCWKIIMGHLQSRLISQQKRPGPILTNGLRNTLTAKSPTFSLPVSYHTTMCTYTFRLSKASDFQDW